MSVTRDLRPQHTKTTMIRAMRHVVGGVMAASLAVVVLLVSCCCRGTEGACPDVERRALLELKHSINYPNGTALSSWGGHAGDGDCCLWRGVTCDNSTGRVIAIDLTSQRTLEQGTWYPNLTMLTHLRKLQELYLNGNQIGGWAFARALCELKHLRALDLGVNLLEGVPPPEFYLCLSQLRSLTALSLFDNQIMGNLPPCLCNMTSLTILYLGHNLLQGNIPPCLGNLYSLEHLILENNKFVGSIPPTIFHNMTNLREFLVGSESSDQLEGTLELSVFANLSKLTSLVLASDHRLEIETESSSWVPSFQLESMSLETSIVNKRSGHGVPSFLSTQNHLTDLTLTECSLTGRLPSWLFCNSSLQQLYLGENLFNGTFPQPCHNSSSAIEILVIGENRIHGSLSNSNWFQFPHLKVLHLGGNELEGQVPPSLGQISLQFLDLESNYLSGELPSDLTRNGTLLEFLALSHNQMHGEMLPRDSNLPNLKFLYLGGNSFTGPISPSISNSSALEVLYVTGNNLGCDLSCLPAFGGSIRGLLLKDNFFEGHLPRHLCQTTYLQFLDISVNNLSGVIPPCFNNISSWNWNAQQGLPQYAMEVGGLVSFQITVPFTSKYSVRLYQGGPLPLMTGLDLSFNKLDGNVPLELGGLKLLQSLNLSYNHLRGSIPPSFSNLLNIESLDLSHNELNGTIPDGLVHLNFLSTFSVAFNDLSGAIPSSGQFSTFNGSSYEGNAGLCGPPLERNCSTEDTKQPDKVMQEEDEKKHGILDNDTLFYSFLALSYALGLWCFFVILLLNRRWRAQYFRAIDKYYDLYLRKACKVATVVKDLSNKIMHELHLELKYIYSRIIIV